MPTPTPRTLAVIALVLAILAFFLPGYPLLIIAVALLALIHLL